LWTSDALDGLVYAAPVIARGLVVVATEGNSVFGVDFATGKVRWRTPLGTPVRRSALPCGNIDPTGITGTPVIDPVAGVVYAVTFTEPFAHTLVALDLMTGAVRSRTPVDPPGQDPKVIQQRAALSFANGRVYVPFGGLAGDCGQYRGYIVGVPITVTGPGTPQVFAVPTARRGAIWTPSGVVIDGAGSVFVATGDAQSTTTFDYGNAVIHLTPDLQISDFWAPRDFAKLSAGDTDLGSVAPTLLGNNLLFQTGKSGLGYLLHSDNLGKVGGEIFSGPVCKGAYGGSAHLPPVIFVPCVDGLVAVKIENDARFSVAWRAVQGGAASPVATDQAVWVASAGNHLLALAPADGHVLADHDLGGKITRFATPAIAAGRVVIAVENRIVCFGA
jgi:outer membrane protein assembly factor BamB